jgi:hypothetical protein
MEFFSLDLGDFLRGRYPFHKLFVCVKSLLRKPGRSTLLMALDETAVWSQETYILARLSDALELSNYLFLKANSSSSADIPVPEPLERPGQLKAAQQEKVFASGQELAEFFNRMSSL